MDNDLIDRVRYYYVNGGDWHSEAAYAAKVLGEDVLDVVAAAASTGHTDDDIAESYEDGYQNGYDDGVMSAGFDDGYEEGFLAGKEQRQG